MRTRMYGGVRGRKTKVGGKPTFVFLLLDFLDAISTLYILRSHLWEEEYVLDSRGVGHEHSKTVDSHTES